MSGINDLLGFSTQQNKIGVEDLLKVSKKKRKSILDDIEQQAVEQVIPQIVIPTSIAEEKQVKILDTFVDKNKITDIKKYQEIRKRKFVDKKIDSEKLQEIIDVNSTEFKQQNQEIKQQLQQLTNEELPDDINYVVTEAEVFEALENISDGDKIDFDDIKIKRIDKKDKTGYFKVKTNIGGDKIPNQLKEISSIVIKNTNGLIKPRICDLRLIGNTNKTQLRGSNLKLSSKTIVYKPDFTKLKVNKGTRFMISVPDDFESTGNFYVYIQESRSKKIIEISRKDFTDIESFNNFLAGIISSYYVEGFDITINKLEIKQPKNSLINVASEILKTHEFKAKPYRDSENKIFAIDFVSTGIKNQWLTVQIIEGDIQNTYDIICKNTADQTWEAKINKKPLLLQDLINNLYQTLVDLYNKDWSAELNIQEDDKFLYLLNKLTHQKLRKALIDIIDIEKEIPEIGVFVKETLSKKDTKFLDKNGESYDAEALIGKTNFVEYFILSFLAYQVKGGDKRNPEEFITSDDYNEKYSVNDVSQYSKRKRTILKKEGELRNYNSRPYIFQIEYSVKGKKHIYRDNTWEGILNETGFLTTDVDFPITKF